MSEDRRSQSEVVGVVLLTGVIVVLVSVVGVVLLAQIDSETEREPRVTITSELTNDEKNLTLTHAGGNRFDTADIRVNLRGDADKEVRLADGSFDAGRNENVFEAGDVWTYEHGISGDELRVTVVDRGSNTVIHENRLIVD